MAQRPFAHLHCHSHYSLLDGANRIPELVEQVKKLGMNSLALTDHGNLYGAIEFYQECKKAQINPIIGYEAYIAPGKRTDREARRKGDAGYHLTLLARNRDGFRNLLKLASIAYLEGYHYVPRIDKELLAAHKEGLICLSGCPSGEFSESILKGQKDEAAGVAEWFLKTFGEKNFFIEIQNNDLEIQKLCTDGAVEIANRMGLPLVATCDAHYLCKPDAAVHDVLLCINTGKTRNDQNRMKFGNDQFYIRTPDEMYQAFPKLEDAVKRSQEIADSCSIELDLKSRHFPVFTPPEKKKPEDYLRELCLKGLEERYKDKDAAAKKNALDRLDHELAIIFKMGFASYFLIVWDFVRFALENGIPASARGSACGAIVSYVLRLSHVDPLEYDLLFERFLDPNRSEAPDIDIDFCQDRREEVIAYVRKRYGEESVAQIGTFGTLQARAAIRDVGRVLDVPLLKVDQIIKMVPEVLNIKLDTALADSADLKSQYDTDPQIKELIDIARRLEGTNRNAGTHAAGVVISSGPLTDHVPLQRIVRKGEDGSTKSGEYAVTTQWEMGILEKVGLLKMDFLGLRTLTLLQNAVALIKKTRGITVEIDKIPLDDPKTYALLQRGDTKGVFQLESDGIRNLLKQMKPDSIHDLIALNALYRPGPLGGGMVTSYVNRKHGREKAEYQHPIMEEVLAETHGVMIYQEQLMRIVNRLGGIELGSSYACIKAISKKNEEIINKRRAEFIRGAQERGASEKTAVDIFDLIAYFSGYGFNKSHSAAYAVVGCQTAYLKAHYPAEFMAALLSSEIEDSNKRDVLVQHIEDARRLGVPVLPPSVNLSEVEFTVVKAEGSKTPDLQSVVFGLTAIKGVGRGGAGAIVRARQEGGAYRDLFDFCERVDLKELNRSSIEKLVKAGAFDCFGAHRAQLWQVLDAALHSGGERQSDARRGQKNFFDMMGGEAEAPTAVSLPDVPEWPASEKLRYEKEALDFYFSSHPLAQYEEDLRSFANQTVDQIVHVPAGQEVLIGGMLTQLRHQTVKKSRDGNTRYIRCKLEDLTGSIECVMWPREYASQKEEVQEDRPCFVKGTVERTREEPGLVLTRIMTIEQGKRELARALGLSMTLTDRIPNDIDRIAEVLRRARGNCLVHLHVFDGAGKVTSLKAGEDYRINPATLSVRELEEILGAGKVRFAGPVNGRNGK